MNIYLDIETIPTQDPAVIERIAADITPPGNYKKQDTIDKWIAEEKPAMVAEAILKTSFDGCAGRIACAAIAFDDGEPLQFYRQDWQAPDAERRVLLTLFAALANATKPLTRKPTFIGHNIVDFDLKFIFQRAVILGVQPPSVIPFRAKPWGDEVFDTMVAWGGRDRVSMDRICRALGAGGKGDIDGSKVWGYVQAGRIDEVADYCADDVARTRVMHKRMTFQSLAA